MEAAGVGHSQQHLAVPRQCRQQLQHGQWHVAEAEHHHARRHGVRRGHVRLQPCQHLAGHGRTRHGQFLGREVGQHGLPQRGLPGLAFGQGLVRTPGTAQHRAPVSPGLQPVTAVYLVLVEQVGQAFGQLQQALRLARAQKMGQRGKHRLGHPLRQQAHEAPDQGCLVQRRHAGHRLAPQHLAIGTPEETRRQLHPGRGTHAMLLRQLHLEPLGHAVALHQHHLRFQLRQWVARQPGRHGIRQRVRLVAVQCDEPGLPVRCHMWSIITCPKPEQLTCVAPSIRRAKS